MSYLAHLKHKWNIKSNWDLFLIMVVFSLAGMFILHERKPIFHLFGITKETPFWIKTVVYLPIVFPLYQLNLLIFGFLLGQFDFFWAKEKQLVRFLARRFGFKG
ncbi:MAG TPA: DUF6787 family protein [Candidatus Omnitrophota bacterium]|nr:DUF6787 family protein [Candidatus Omnitrophota bacterium]